MAVARALESTPLAVCKLGILRCSPSEPARKRDHRGGRAGHLVGWTGRFKWGGWPPG